MNSAGYWVLAVEAPMPELLTYTDFALSDDEKGLLKRGTFVLAPLQNRKVLGLVIGPGYPIEGVKIKSIVSLEPQYPVLKEEFINWLEWLSKYYLYPLGQIIGSVLPPLKKTDKLRKSKKSAVVQSREQTKPPQFTEEQRAAIEAIRPGLNEFHVHLLFGVTGSGKTEIYMNLLSERLESGKAGILIVPEISLTPQLTQRFAERFGENVAVLHSQLTPREKTNQWWDFFEGRRKILIGARSALFCPVQNLGLIIVDEEHETSFKQDEKLKYHARDAAVMLAHLSRCTVILGSATPSIETWNNVITGKYKLCRLANRVENRSLPEIRVIDLKEMTEKRKITNSPDKDLPFWLSRELFEEMQATLLKGEQVALFLNRRGYAQSVHCPSCAHVKECPNCDISLTLHGDRNLVCHYCDYHELLDSNCSHCKEGIYIPIGLGTEQAELELQKVFPEARIARADRDEITTREEMENLIASMEIGQIDILIGTQMIAKGLDFPKLTMVGIIMADIGFNIPDFRSSERSFQLLTQMSGRAGRHIPKGQGSGRVLVQTFNPSHPSVLATVNGNYEAFAARELEERRDLGYPPYGKLILLRVQSSFLDRARSTCNVIQKRFEFLHSKNSSYQLIEVLGPVEAPIFKLRNVYRFQFLLKGTNASIINSFLRQVLGQEDWVPPGVRLIPDIDPQNLLS